MLQLVTIVAIVACADVVLGKTSLILPTSANCGNQAVLTCTSTDCNLGYRFLKDNVDIYSQKGPQNVADPDRYSATVTSNSQVQLTIANIQLSDSGAYACNCAFEPLSAFQTMNYTCKASTSKATITPEKKLNITVDSLYPQPSSVVTRLTNPSTGLLGTYTCVFSSILVSHHRCTWLSTTSLQDGNHDYTTTVTTEKEDVLVSGSFRIVTPTSPAISNLVTISSNRHMLIGKQDRPLNIQCLSSGGIPVPTLAWYRGNTSTSPLAQSRTSDSLQQSDGTYTVTLTHIYTPRREDDLTTFLCRLFYPGATIEASTDPSPATALLYIDLKPDNGTVSQTGEAVSGESMLLNCRSANGRPAPNITWFYQGQTFTPINNSSYNATSDTYTVVSVLKKPVSAEDNGLTATCYVLHTTLSEPLARTINVDVKFGPLVRSTTISGNQQTSSMGTDMIRLNCTSGSSNPASNITWYNGSDVISKAGSYLRWSGDNKGVITSNILTITPTRYMDGDRITCMPDNGYGNDSTYVDLDILYSPLIEPLLNLTSTEGEPDVSLKCLASSKPPATFTWKKGNMTLVNGNGTIADNSFSYVIHRVDRSDTGSYTCQAGNNFGSSEPINIYLLVKYPPAVTVSTTSTPTYTITCTAEGYPDSYTYQDWVQVWPGYGPVAIIPFTETTLTLTNSTYERSGVYICSASNGVAVYDTNTKFIRGNATVLIEAPPVLTDQSPDVERVLVAGGLGKDATTEIKYWSNIDGSVVKCYKHVGDSRSSLSSCSVTETDTEVTLPVYNHMVKLAGTLAIIKIHISSEEDMTAYDVVVSNGLNRESVRGITIVPQGLPEAPTLTSNISITPGQVILTVVPGFHGGYNQTLVVQISKDLTTWFNNTFVNIGLKDRPINIVLSNLHGSTLHQVRMFAYNIEGGSKNFSAVMNFTTAEDPPTHSRPASAALIGGAIGTTCVLLVVAAVLVVVWKKRNARWMSSKRGDRRDFAKDQDNPDSVVECAMYVSAENVHPGTSSVAVYSTPQKRERSDLSLNVYAVVSKSRKGLSEIPKVAETNFNNTESPSSNRPTRSTQTFSEDGLIYVDVDFDSNAEYDAIHGLDNVTDYVTIDFTKTAEPLPVIDEGI